MSHTKRAISLLVAVALVILATPIVAGSVGAPKRCIVLFDNAAVSDAAMARLEGLGAVKVKELRAAGGAVVYLPTPAAERAAAKVPGVALVEADVRASTNAKPVKPAPVQPAEVLPWGVDRIEADTVWGTTTAGAIKVAIVDTGIDLAHPDLAANVVGGANMINPRKSPADDNGHGTHVAGTVAGIDNEIGVVGTAPEADLYAVKVLGRDGSGWVSDIVEGIAWSVDADVDVINMSLGSAAYSLSLDQAVQSALAQGVVVVASAGNEGPAENTVGYPAALPGVIAVAATDSSDAIAYFSSRGPQVDIAAPGVNVYSTYKGSTYKSLSGTSMASPHVTGAVALLLSTPEPTDGIWTPAEVRARLVETAQDLGAAGFDTAYGYGLVRVDAALAQ